MGIVRWIASALLTATRIIFGVFPLRLRGDVLYQWASFRLRRRPLKIFSWVFLLGALCWLGEWSGDKWAVPRLVLWVQKLPNNDYSMILYHTCGAIFSSLNLLSCFSLIIVGRTLRHLDQEGHLEMLMLVPGQVRPSALFHAVSSRYLPLAFAAILVLYLDPVRSPFHQPPFELPRPLQFGFQPSLADLQRDLRLTDSRNLWWWAIEEFSLFLFCPANLFMDLAISYWIYCRWRVSATSIILTFVLIGVVEPVVWMWMQMRIGRWLQQTNYFQDIRNQNPYWVPGEIVNTGYYGLTAILSIFITWTLLADLDGRWHRITHSTKRDPIMIRTSR